MTHRRLLLATLTVLAVLLAACSSPQAPSMSAAETGTAIEELSQAVSTVGSAAAWSRLPTNALGHMSSVPLPLGATPEALPRGEYDYDESGSTWLKTADSDDLELNWDYDLAVYRLAVDWDATAPTRVISLQSGVSNEVPTGAAARLTEGGVEVGGLAATSAWTANQCGYDEPTGASSSGFLGDSDARVTLDRLGFTINDTAGSDTVSAEAEATAAAGGDSLNAYLELHANGEIERGPDCNLVNFVPTSGNLALGATANVAGEQSSFEFRSNFSDVMFDAGALSGLGLDGSLRLNGVLAVAFSGALNDANANGVPGDELLLTFADAQTMTLEAFLLDQIGWAPLAAMRMMVR